MGSETYFIETSEEGLISNPNSIPVEGIKFILYITFGGIALFYGGINFPYPTAIIVMVVSVGFLVYTRKWFE